MKSGIRGWRHWPGSGKAAGVNVTLHTHTNFSANLGIFYMMDVVHYFNLHKPIGHIVFDDEHGWRKVGNFFINEEEDDIIEKN
jgi:hypothetical protein